MYLYDVTLMENINTMFLIALHMCYALSQVQKFSVMTLDGKILYFRSTATVTHLFWKY